MIVIVRHGDRKYENGKNSYRKLDSPIKDEEYERGRVIFSSLIEKYSLLPTKIISSPMRRTRDTARILSKLANKEIEVEKDISGYLGWQKRIENKDFYPETNKYSPYKKETMKEYKERILSCFSKIRENNKEGVIWIITHNCAVHAILESYGIIPGHTAPFSGAIITAEEVICI